MHALLTYFYHFTSSCKLWRKITCISIFGFIFINLYVLFYCINISCMYWEYKLRNIRYSTTRKISHMNSLISLYLLQDILFFRLRLNIPIFQPILGWKNSWEHLILDYTSIEVILVLAWRKQSLIRHTELTSCRNVFSVRQKASTCFCCVLACFAA